MRTSHTLCEEHRMWPHTPVYGSGRRHYSSHGRQCMGTEAQKGRKCIHSSCLEGSQRLVGEVRHGITNIQYEYVQRVLDNICQINFTLVMELFPNH